MLEYTFWLHKVIIWYLIVLSEKGKHRLKKKSEYNLTNDSLQHESCAKFCLFCDSRLIDLQYFSVEYSTLQRDSIPTFSTWTLVISKWKLNTISIRLIFLSIKMTIMQVFVLILVYYYWNANQYNYKTELNDTIKSLFDVILYKL